MTWLKTGDEYPIDCARVNLSDAAYRTHHEGLTWVMARESDGFVSTRDVRRFAETADPLAAITELVDVGFWQKVDGGWLIVHHMENQPTHEELVARRASNAERQRRFAQKRAEQRRD
jgi:hypothetical protein